MEDFTEVEPLDKPKSIAWLIGELDQDVNHEHLTHAKRDDYLEQLKTYTRTAEDAAPLCTEQGILLLCRHGFDHGTAKTSRTALKCLANVMLLNDKTRQIFVNHEYPSRAAKLFEHDNREDEFLSARILFLLTYGTDFDFNTIFGEKQLLEAINTNLARHMKYFVNSNQRKRMPSIGIGDAASPGFRPADLKVIEANDQAQKMALGETLKLLFNIATFYPSIKPKLAPSFEPALKLLQGLKLQSPPLQPPVTYLINALLCLDFDNQKSCLFPTLDAKSHVDRLIHILDLALVRQTEAELERVANPIVALTRKIYEIAPKSIKAHLRTVILPSDKDREKPLGQSESMSSRLLRLSGSLTAPTLAKSVQELLFELSGKDASRFVRNIGLGFASGFLASHNMTVPESANEAWSVRDSADSGRVVELDDDDDDDDDDDYDEGGGEKKEYGGFDGVAEADKKVLRSDSTTPRPIPSTKSPQPLEPSDYLVNPVTGQRKDMEDSNEEDTMTEEEKMREAERLFYLFERLRATGVVDFENPIAKAAREGRLGE